MQKAQIKDVLFHWIPLARQSAKRFPLTILTALLCTVFSLYLVWNSNYSDQRENYLLLLSLGIALFTAISLLPIRTLAAKFKISESTAKIGINGLGIAAIGASMFVYYRNDDAMFKLSFAILFLIVHLAVAIAPFLFNRDQLSFWRYNQALFSRAILTGAYAALLFGGIAIGIWSLDPLFSIKFGSRTYLSVWCLISFTVSVLFFLAAVPEDPENIPPKEYPSELRILVPNVALPLIAIYVTILYVYAVKILATQDWPEGKIGWLISSLSFVVVLANLLVYPIGEDSQRPFVRWLNKNVYRFLLPLMVILYLALFERVRAYGWTEARYALLALSLWMTFVAAASAGKKRLSIFWIPTSLLLVAIVTGYGPLNMFRVSERSQASRIESMLRSLRYVGNGKVGSFGTEPTFQQRRELASSLEFICNRGGVESIKRALQVDFEFQAGLGSRYDGGGCYYDEGSVAKAMRLAGTSYPTGTYNENSKEEHFALSFDSSLEQDVELKTQKLVMNEVMFWDYNPSAAKEIQTLSNLGSWNSKSRKLTITLKDRTSYEFDLREEIERLRDSEPARKTHGDRSPLRPWVVNGPEGTLVIKTLRIEIFKAAGELPERAMIENLQGVLIAPAK